MIISDTHGYVFVELPRTGSTAVSQELREQYDGRAMLRKHATYEEFLRHASPTQQGYYAFSGIRHPMDSVVSRYFKLKSDHHGRFSRDDDEAEPGRLNRVLDKRMFRFIRDRDADFATFFLRFYHLPYDTWASLSHERMDGLLRFERLGADFERVLGEIGIAPVRPLPVVNATSRDDDDFSVHFTPETRQRARRIFGPYMERWGYEFPAAWNLDAPSSIQIAAYRSFSWLAQLYWRHLRGRI